MKKYDLIYLDLKEKIINKEYKEYLPSEKELQNIYDVSRGTVRTAIKKLEANGFCTTYQGLRTKVTPQKNIPFAIEGYKSFNFATKDKSKWSTNVIAINHIKVDEELAWESNFAIGADVIEVLRTRLINDKSVILDHHYFLQKIVKEITPEIAEKSIYEYLETILNIEPTFTRWNWTCEPVNEQTKMLLDGKLKLVMINKKHAFLTDNTQFEFTISYYHPKYFDLKTVNTRN